jgi:hypothetical protein
MDHKDINLLQFKAPEGRIIESFLRTINGIIGLTNKELEVTKWLIEASEQGIVTTETKANIRTVLNMSNVQLNMVIMQLKKKGVLLHRDAIRDYRQIKLMFINPQVIPKIGKEGIAVLIEIHKYDPNS